MKKSFEGKEPRFPELVSANLFDESSEAGSKTLGFVDYWLKGVNNYIKENLIRLTCKDIMDMYYALFGELKRFRSSSTGFTGFSEFLIFRTLYHTIGQKFDPVQAKNPKPTDPIIFKSRNYEIGQNVAFKLDERKYPCHPDVYIKKRVHIHEEYKLISIIQVKIHLQGEPSQIKSEAQTFSDLQLKYKGIKGLFIVMCNDRFSSNYEKTLKDANYETVVLQENPRKIARILKQFI